MSIDYGFDTTDIELESLTVPEGKYKVMIDNEEPKQTQAGDKKLNVTYQILEGDYKGKLIFMGYNIWHSNEKARNIAAQDIKKIAEATDKPVNKDFPLKGRVLVITYAKQKDSDYMRISKYEKSDTPF